MKKVFIIKGMHCESCKKIIEMDLKEEPGVDSVSVNYDTKKALVEFNPDQISAEKIKNIIEKSGYSAVEE